MPPELQTRLLRVLSGRRSSTASAGISRSRPTCASSPATHQDLEAQREAGAVPRRPVSTGINVIRLRLPPHARAARGHPAARAAFPRQSARELSVEAKRLSEADAEHYLVTQDLPGQRAPARRVCHWVTVMAAGINIEVKDLAIGLRFDAAAATEQNWASARA